MHNTPPRPRERIGSITAAQPVASRERSCSSSCASVSPGFAHLDKTFANSRAIRLVCAPAHCQDWSVLRCLPYSDLSLQDWVLGRRLVHHVGHPRVPASRLAIYLTEQSICALVVPSGLNLRSATCQHSAVFLMIGSAYGSNSLSL